MNQKNTVELINAINNLTKALNKHIAATQVISVKPSLTPINPEIIVKMLPAMVTLFLVVFSLVQLLPELRNFLKADFVTPMLSKQQRRVKNAKRQFWVAYIFFAFALIWMILYLALYNLLIIFVPVVILYIVSFIGPLSFTIGLFCLALVISKWVKHLFGGG